MDYCQFHLWAGALYKKHYLIVGFFNVKQKEINKTWTVHSIL